jgi:hypothetical protein
MRTPSADTDSLQQISVTGTVRSWASMGVASSHLSAATVAAFAGRPGAALVGLAAAYPSYAMTLGQLPGGTSRISTGARAQEHLDTYQLGVYLRPDIAKQSLEVAIVGRAAADTLAQQVGLVRDASRSLLIGTIRDCAGRPVSNAIVTVSAMPETALHVGGAASAYFTPAGQAAPPGTVSATSGAGRFMVMNLPAYAGDAFIQAWGFTSEEDMLSGRLTLIAMVPAPIPVGSALIVELEPRRD